LSTLQDDDELELPPKKYLSHSEGQHSFAGSPEEKSEEEEDETSLAAIELLGEEADANEDVEAESKPAQEDDDDDIEWLKEISGVPQ